MSTRSNIAMVNDDGKSVTMIYCHWDGYPSNNGSILLEHYQDPEKIRQLLALGDLSFLGLEIGEKHDFDDIDTARIENWTTAYTRDRGEDCPPSVITMDKDFDYTSLCEQEYLYLWKNGEWYFSDHGAKLKVLRKSDCVDKCKCNCGE